MTRVQGSALGPTTSGSHPTSDTNIVIRPSAEGSPAPNQGPIHVLSKYYDRNMQSLKRRSGDLTLYKRIDFRLYVKFKKQTQI